MAPYKGVVMLPGKPKPDLRIVRLVVSIIESDLKWFFSDGSKLRLALEYFDLRETFGWSWEYTFDDLVELFNNIYTNDSEIFGRFFQYLLNRLEEYENDLSKYSFMFQELRTLGYDYDFEKRVIRPAVEYEKEETKALSELEVMLSNLNPKYVEMYRGSWEALLSKKPDNFRHSISSMREMLRQIIDQLGSGETRKQKIESILKSTTEAELVDSFANITNRLYALQSAKEHTAPDFESTLFALRVAQYVLYFLLKKRSK